MKTKIEQIKDQVRHWSLDDLDELTSELLAMSQTKAIFDSRWSKAAENINNFITR